MEPKMNIHGNGPMEHQWTTLNGTTVSPMIGAVEKTVLDSILAITAANGMIKDAVGRSLTFADIEM